MNDSRGIYIFGAGSLASLALHYASENGQKVEGFVVDQPIGPNFCNLPVFDWNSFEKVKKPAEKLVFVAIGYKSMLKRAEVFHRVQKAGYRTINIISSASYVAKNASIGTNNLIMPGAVIEPGATIGDNNVFWSNTTICHDVVIAHHCFFASNSTIGGATRIGSRNFFGFSSTVLQQKTVGNDNLIAAQALVLDNIQDNGQFVGAPARKSKAIPAHLGVTIE